MNKRELLCGLLQIIFEAENCPEKRENILSDLRILAKKISLDIKEEIEDEVD